MRHVLRDIYNRLVLFGIDPRQAARSARAWPSYRRDLRALRRQAAASGDAFPLAPAHPCLGEASAEGGLASGHYFHQDLLVARRIFERTPERHLDVGSRIDGFVAHVAAFRPIEVLDIRPTEGSIPNVTFLRADLMAPLPDELLGCCDSLSCLHALEHFGLGRYGDPVDFAGHVRGLENLARIVKPGGSFYLSVPIGPQRIEFNAHRVFSVGYLLELLAEWFELERFSYVDDAGDLHEDVPLTPADVASDFGCAYGCGIFETVRR